jgi:6-phosphogluconate dehydrogenase
MTNSEKNHLYELGMIGLGVMGRNLLLNMADHGFKVAGLDKDESKVDALKQEGEAHEIYATNNIKDFVDSLKTPRAIMLLVPAGSPVDSVINELIPLLDQGDLIIDAGNSYFKDTDRREQELSHHGILFMGVGVSGGEEGARHGPSMMPGGPKVAYERVRSIFEAVAAKVKNEPCVRYMGPHSAGHFVKMVHNGIEYGIMQLIAETYDFMKRGLNCDNSELAVIYSEWNKTELNSYLLEITANIFLKKDSKNNHDLIDEIKAVAKQNGTGMWTSQSAMQLQVPTSTIDAAVSARDMSGLSSERNQASLIYTRNNSSFTGNKDTIILQIKHALYAGIIMTYAQGMALLTVASTQYKYNLDLESVSHIWRGGCIIRSALLTNICEAFKHNKNLSNLLLDPGISQLLINMQTHLCKVVTQGCDLGVPIPALMASLGYFNSFCNKWLPANLIQAQRDYFGSHTYERVDEKGTFHTEWEKI